jgi:hypothetical protein
MAETQQDVAQYQSDHDLLVKLNERVDGLTRAVEKKNDDHETRIRDLESKVDAQESSARTWRYVVSIALVILGLGVSIIGAYISRT